MSVDLEKSPKGVGAEISFIVNFVCFADPVVVGEERRPGGWGGHTTTTPSTTNREGGPGGEGGGQIKLIPGAAKGRREVRDRWD